MRRIAPSDVKPPLVSVCFSLLSIRVIRDIFRPHHTDRNLKKDAQGIDEASSANSAPSVEPAPPPPSSVRPQQPATLLTTTAMDMILSKYAEEEENTAPAAPETVQGLTQMYYLEEKDEIDAMCIASAASELSRNREAEIADVATTVPNAGLFAFEESDCWPVGLSQMFYVEDAHEEAAAAARALPLANRSFLRENFGVPGEVVQDLRQVWDAGGHSQEVSMCPTSEKV